MTIRGVHSFCQAGLLLVNLLSIGLLAVAQPVVAAPAALTLQDIDGQAVLIAHDGTYLGKVSSTTWDADSICTSWGEYGSTWGAHSIRTTWGQYGSRWSTESAYNDWTTTPPLIVHERQVVGYVTKNTTSRGAVDPDVLFAIYGCSS